MTAWKDGTFLGLLLIGSGLLAAAIVFYRMDMAFLDDAVQSDAVVVDKFYRSRIGESDGSRSIAYEWADASHQPPMAWTGQAPYSGGREAFDALVPGESTVRIAWRYLDDGRSVESRLLQDGFTGMPWPMLLIGIALLIAALIRFTIVHRTCSGDQP
ncbi:MAG: hypothetical protein Kow0020_06710 [Wenzhouxiangellaceae bacterium]